MSIGITLLDNVNVNTIGEAKNTNGFDGALYFQAQDWGGASVTIELSIDNANWIQLTRNDAPFAVSQNQVNKIEKIGQAAQIRAVLSNASGMTNNVKVVYVR